MADEAKKTGSAKHKVKNISAGPRFFHHDTGTVTLDPGQEWEGPVDIRQFERRDATGVEFQIDGKQSKAIAQAVKSDEFDKLTDQQLRDVIQKRDPKKPLAGNIDRASLLELAREE